VHYHDQYEKRNPMPYMSEYINAKSNSEKIPKKLQKIPKTTQKVQNEKSTKIKKEQK